MAHMSVRIAQLALFAIIAACAGTPKEYAEGQRECRTLEVTGSKIAKRDCRTATEWAKHDELEAARNAESMLSNYRSVDPSSFD